MLEGRQGAASIHEQLDADAVALQPALEQDRRPGPEGGEAVAQVGLVDPIRDDVRLDRPVGEHLPRRHGLHDDGVPQRRTDRGDVLTSLDRRSGRHGHAQLFREVDRGGLVVRRGEAGRIGHGKGRQTGEPVTCLGERQEQLVGDRHDQVDPVALDAGPDRLDDGIGPLRRPRVDHSIRREARAESRARPIRIGGGDTPATTAQ
jgi:hypothetical protein